MLREGLDAGSDDEDSGDEEENDSSGGSGEDVEEGEDPIEEFMAMALTLIEGKPDLGVELPQDDPLVDPGSLLGVRTAITGAEVLVFRARGDGRDELQGRKAVASDPAKLRMHSRSHLPVPAGHGIGVAPGHHLELRADTKVCSGLRELHARCLIRPTVGTAYEQPQAAGTE